MDDSTPQVVRDGQSDDGEFLRCFTKHARQIYGYIRTLLPSQADAEDVFQETSVILWEKFADFQHGSNFLAWACRIAYYRVMNRRRRKTPFVFGDTFYEIVDKESLAQNVYFEAQHRALADCFLQLSPSDRELIEQRFRSSDPIKQIAARLGKSLRSVYRAYDRIYQALLKCIPNKNLRRSPSEWKEKWIPWRK